MHLENYKPDKTLCIFFLYNYSKIINLDSLIFFSNIYMIKVELNCQVIISRDLNVINKILQKNNILFNMLKILF